MYDKLNFIYIEMDKFKKTESELANHLEWWLYFLKKLVSLDEIPSTFQNDIIADAFNIAKLSNMSYANRHEYEISLKHYRDLINVLESAKKEGIEEGIEIGIEEGIEIGIIDGKLETAQHLKQLGVAIETIAEATGLSLERLRNNRV